MTTPKKTKRVVYTPWDAVSQEIGKFYLSHNTEIKIWLPQGVVLDYVDIEPYKAPEVPKEVLTYKPTITPPNEHPRLWVTKETLPTVQENLAKGENRAKWEEVKKIAFENIDIKIDANQEMSFDIKLENCIEAKAFYYLMTNDSKIGKEAVALAKDYISAVSFGNLLDVTREIGRTI